MLSDNLKERINLQWEKYNSEEKSVPKIVAMIPAKDGAWAKFNTNDLYNGKYILYVDKELEDTDDLFIEQIIFHELTHVADSIKCVESGMGVEQFKKYMDIFSETHASKIQMDRMIKTQKLKPNTINQRVVYRDGTLTLKSYMEQTYKQLINEFSFPTARITMTNLKFNAKKLYHYIGYIISLREHGISYEWKFSDIPECFKSLFEEIAHTLSEGNDSSSKLILLEQRLTDEIKKQITIHNKVQVSLLVDKILTSKQTR